MKTRLLLRGLPALALAAWQSAMPARAQDSGKAASLSGAVTLVSDYRWRGSSLSNRGWAIQGSL